MLYEIHMLKNYPPVNLNRDDTGSPKTCYFGGVQRGRISSQCLKRAWRTSKLYEQLLFDSRGVRTRALPALLRDELHKRNCDEAFIEEAMKKAIDLVKREDKDEGKDKDDAAIKKKADKEQALRTEQVILYAPQDIVVVADRMEELYKEIGSFSAFCKLKKTEVIAKFADVKIRPITLDIALFGRMVTSDAFRNVEAAMQVAHAISTHAVNLESDYYTAVDDLVVKGAASIGDINYNACCYYHYVSIDSDLLRDNLEYTPDRDALIEALLPALIRILACTNPGGKQNTFAGHILPSLLCVEVKADRIPVSYANAFAKPVNLRSEDVIPASIARLREEIDKTDAAFRIASTRLWFSPDGQEAPKRAEVCRTLQELEQRSAAASQRG